MPVDYVDLYQAPKDLPPPPPDLCSSSVDWNTFPGVFGLQPAEAPTSLLHGRHLQEVSVDGQKAMGFQDSSACLTIVDPRVVRPGALQPGPGIAIQ